jgi:hypothetical protein
MTAGAMELALSGKVKTALIMAIIALVFFIGVFIRHWSW